MDVKMRMDRKFIEEFDVDDQMLVRLENYHKKLRIGLGMVIALLLLTPELLNIETGAAPALIVSLIFAPLGLVVYLLVAPKWRRVPMISKRDVILLSLAISLLAFLSIPLMDFINGNGERLFTLGFFGAIGYGIYKLTYRWMSKDEGEDEMFP